MEVRPATSPGEIQEAIDLSRPRYFWLKFFAANWYASLICIVVICLDLDAFVTHSNIKLQNSLIMLLVGAGLLVFSWNRWRWKVAKALTGAGERMESLSLDPDGVRIRLTSGTATFVPWAGYKNWREGRNIFLLTGTDGTTILPADEADRESIRTLLTASIGRNGPE
jgi:hypothetical protein